MELFIFLGNQFNRIQLKSIWDGMQASAVCRCLQCPGSGVTGSTVHSETYFRYNVLHSIMHMDCDNAVLHTVSKPNYATTYQLHDNYIATAIFKTVILLYMQNHLK